MSFKSEKISLFRATKWCDHFRHHIDILVIYNLICYNNDNYNDQLSYGASMQFSVSLI